MLESFLAVLKVGVRITC